MITPKPAAEIIRDMAAARRRAENALSAAAANPGRQTFPSELRTEVVHFTGALAEKYLQANDFHAGRVEPGEFANRPFKPELADRYATTMLKGQWQLTHQGIGIAEDGTLLDGQHRLFAVVLADQRRPGFIQPMNVTYGLLPEAFAAVDVGRNRTLTDMVGMGGHRNAANLSGCSRLVWLYDHHRHQPGEWKRSIPTANDILGAIAAEPNMAASVLIGARIRHMLLPSVAFAGSHLIVRHWGETAATEFVSRLQSGADLSDGSALLALRRGYENQKAKHYNANRAIQLGMWIKGFNYHLAGRTNVRMIVYKLGIEDMPELARPTP